MNAPLEAALRRDRATVLAGLALLTSFCWWFSLRPSAHGHHGVGLPEAVVLWTVMMAGMMAPSAAPRVLGVAGLARRAGERRPLPAAAVFLGGYLAAWTAFSVLAAVAEWGARTAAHASAALGGAAPALGGGLLLAAGLYQFTPLKRACLAHCRGDALSPPADETRSAGGAFAAGLGAGMVCIGSCWGLMLVLFVAGTMSVRGMVALTAVVLLEKLAPGGAWFGRAAGAALVAGGAWRLLGG
jgi:predicted metal-binding membrane protein